jgi:hypothetical protein
MDANLVAEAEQLRHTTERMQRAGLIIDLSCLTREHRRAVFALQCVLAGGDERPTPRREAIGFAYPSSTVRHGSRTR